MCVCVGGVGGQGENKPSSWRYTRSAQIVVLYIYTRSDLFVCLCALVYIIIVFVRCGKAEIYTLRSLCTHTHKLHSVSRGNYFGLWSEIPFRPAAAVAN